IASLRKELDEANKAVREKDDFEAERRARRLAGEINRLGAGIERYELRVANALWGGRTYPFKRAYLDASGKHYGQVAFHVDFRKEPEAARKRINAWVEEHTRDRIKGLIPPKAIDPFTRLVLANAVYFKGQWSDPFAESSTRPRPFSMSGG